MPQIIDLEAIQNGDFQNDPSPKYVHSSFTGGPKKSKGFFTKDNYKLFQMFDNQFIALQTSKEDNEAVQFIKNNKAQIEHFRKIIDNENKKYIIDHYYPEEINIDYIGNDNIKKANSQKGFHYYLNNKRLFAPVSVDILAESVETLGDLTIKQKDFQLLNLNQWVQGIQNNQTDSEYVPIGIMPTNQTNVTVYQKAIPLNISAFSVVGEVNALLNYYVAILLTTQNINNLEEISILKNEKLSNIKNIQPTDKKAYLFLVPLYFNATETFTENIKQNTYFYAIKEITRFFVATSTQNFIDQLKNQNIYQSIKYACKTKKELTQDVYAFLDIISNKLKENQLTNEKEAELSYLMIRLLGAIENVNAKDTIFSISEMSTLFNKLNEMKNDFQLSKKFMNKIQSVSLIMELNLKLNELNATKTNLKTFTANNLFIKQQLMDAKKYSQQQKNIILSEEPLIIGQAGAGSGKSHTILGRIDYLRYQGIDLNNVLVLSFTNVAASNIIKRWPQIKSKTIASMIDDIYQLNFNHGLSQAGTLKNAISLLNTNSPYFTDQGLDAEKLLITKNALINILDDINKSYNKHSKNQKSNNVLTKELNNIIANYFQEVVAILDAVEQTTLEIEPILTLELMRQFPEKLKMPSKYQNIEFIITDESQDISAFEYILLLEIVLFYKAQLLIVGDGSQTLYEFRSADPRCLSTLESSGVFKTFKLDTNYRSNQEILTYANQYLKAIDANKQAQIQLHANSLKSIDLKSFKEHVKLTNINKTGDGLNREERIKETLVYNKDIKNYIMDALFADQQVAILAWTRKEKDAAKEAFEQILKEFKEQDNFTVNDISTLRSAPTTFLSTLARYLDDNEKMLKAYLDAFKNKYITETTFKQSVIIEWDKIIKSTIRSNGDYIAKRIHETVEKFINNPSFELHVQSYVKGQMDIKTFNATLKQLLLKAEIQMNNLRNVYLQNQKENINYDDMKCIVSTIHGAKGLEFDNVIVLYDEKANRETYNQMRSIQEELRLFFVAFSRAKQTEWIINFHSGTTSASSNDTGMLLTPIRTAYLKTIDELTDFQEQQN